MRDRIVSLLLEGVSLPDGSALVLNDTLHTRFEPQPDRNTFIAVLFDGMSAELNLANAQPSSSGFAVVVFGRVMDDLLTTAHMAFNALLASGEFALDATPVFPVSGDLAQVEIIATKQL